MAEIVTSRECSTVGREWPIKKEGVPEKQNYHSHSSYFRGEIFKLHREAKNMGTQQFMKFLGSLVLFFGSVTVAYADLPHPLTVDFPAPLHFLTPGGEDVVLPAGTYQVEAAESWLKLIPEGQTRFSAILVEASSGTHDELLIEPVVRAKADSEDPDTFHLAMLLADGTGLEAVGTQSGIRPRGWRSAFMSKLRKARTFRSRGRPATPKATFKSQLGRPKISLPPRATQVYVPPRVPVLPKPCLKKTIDDFKLESPGWVKIDCQLNLPTGPPVKKRLIFETTGVTLNCNGRTLGIIGGPATEMIQVRSRKFKDNPKNISKDHPDYEKLPWKWERPQNVTIKKCNIIGSVRVWGMGRNGEAKDVRESSKREKSKSMNHINRLRNNAPKNIVFDDVIITGVGTIVEPNPNAPMGPPIVRKGKNPFYLGPGVTYSKLINSELKGKSPKVGIYLDAESAYNTIKDNNIDVKTGKDTVGDNLPGMKSRGWPIIAIDGSSHNKIFNNRFSQTNRGGIYLYRNCGEGGTIRHATPSHNTIMNNVFYYNKYTGGKPSVYLGSRDYGFKERLGHCDNDDGRPYGSSASETDYAQHNVVMQNQFYKRRVYKFRPGGTVLVEASIADYVKTRNTKANSPNYIEHNQIVTPQTVVKKRRAGCYLPNASPNFLLHGRSLDTLKDSGNKACLTQSSCTDGELSRSNASDCRVNKVDFSCQVSGNNKGCQKTIACPSGKKLVGAKAACNLEFGTVSSSALQPILPNLIKVLKASDKVSAGSCHVGGNKLQRGQKEITINKSSRTVAVGCKEHDKNGGDCHIKGMLYCR